MGDLSDGGITVERKTPVPCGHGESSLTGGATLQSEAPVSVIILSHQNEHHSRPGGGATKQERLDGELFTFNPLHEADFISNPGPLPVVPGDQSELSFQILPSKNRAC